MKKSRRSKMQTVSFSLVLSLLLALTVTACSSGNGNSTAEPNSSPNSAVNEPGGTTNQTDPAEEELKPEAGAKLMVWEAKEQVEYMKQLAADFEKNTAFQSRLKSWRVEIRVQGWQRTARPN